MNRCILSHRTVLTSLNIIGVIPPVVFVKDYSKSRLERVEHLLKTADFGPDFVPTDIGQHMRSYPRPPLEESEELDDEDDIETYNNIKGCDGPEDSADDSEVSDARFESIMSEYDGKINWRGDLYGVDHTGISKQLISKQKKVRDRNFGTAVPSEIPLGSYSEENKKLDLDSVSSEKIADMHFRKPKKERKSGRLHYSLITSEDVTLS